MWHRNSESTSAHATKENGTKAVEIVSFIKQSNVIHRKKKEENNLQKSFKYLVLFNLKLLEVY